MQANTIRALANSADTASAEQQVNEGDILRAVLDLERLLVIAAEDGHREVPLWAYRPIDQPDGGDPVYMVLWQTMFHGRLNLELFTPVHHYSLMATPAGPISAVDRTLCFHNSTIRVMELLEADGLQVVLEVEGETRHLKISCTAVTTESQDPHYLDH